MHASSMENMERCFRRYIAGSELEKKPSMRVLDVGGTNVNGSYAEIFSGSNIEYVVADLEPSDCVDVVLDDPYVLPFADGSFDVVVSGQMLEHCEFFWIAFKEMMRVVSSSGYVFLIVPSAGDIHRYPVDCYRFNPDSFSALASYSECFLIDLWHDKKGPWFDLVGVFSMQKDHSQSGVTVNQQLEAINSYVSKFDEMGEKQQGSQHYLETLKLIHKELTPNFYFEIGVRNGLSISLAKCNALGVDPVPEITVELTDAVEIIKKTSDDYFRSNSDVYVGKAPDLVFIDGMHLFEYALRDFMNVEKNSKNNTVVVIDDVFPNHPSQASRERKTRVWTGDVWKLYYCLKKYRKDLFIVAVDTSPTGIIMISGLDAQNRTLWDGYNTILNDINKRNHLPPSKIIERQGAICPKSNLFIKYLKGLSDSGGRHESLEMIHNAVEESIGDDEQPHIAVKPSLKLSIVVIVYNMPREIYRTLKSLSPLMQDGIKENEYEIIVVDNNSTREFDIQKCQKLTSNITFLKCSTKSSSPVEAINMGIKQANADFIGVMIDGARMVSPGLLAASLKAGSRRKNLVVGTLAFHLGDKVQMESVSEGYNQQVEDELLNSVDWENDGYKLFDVSVFAGSSKGGWFDLPAETNALFMHKQLWLCLKGYDERFQQPGGGLANLDTWERACTYLGTEVTLLLGEGTFHQFHGGVATNSNESSWSDFHEEYLNIRKKPYKRPMVSFSCFGNVHSSMRRVLG